MGWDETGYIVSASIPSLCIYRATTIFKDLPEVLRLQRGTKDHLSSPSTWIRCAAKESWGRGWNKPGAVPADHLNGGGFLTVVY